MAQLQARRRDLAGSADVVDSRWLRDHDHFMTNLVRVRLSVPLFLC
jgi:hypothetical protein